MSDKTRATPAACYAQIIFSTSLQAGDFVSLLGRGRGNGSPGGTLTPPWTLSQGATETGSP